MRIEDLEYLTQEDVRRIRLVSEALGWQPERVVKTEFTKIILELACKVVEIKSHYDYKEHLLETIDKFLKDYNS